MVEQPAGRQQQPAGRTKVTGRTGRRTRPEKGEKGRKKKKGRGGFGSRIRLVLYSPLFYTCLCLYLFHALPANKKGEESQESF